MANIDEIEAEQARQRKLLEGNNLLLNRIMQRLMTVAGKLRSISAKDCDEISEELKDVGRILGSIKQGD